MEQTSKVLQEQAIPHFQASPAGQSALLSTMTERNHCQPSLPPGGGTSLHTVNRVTIL